jgi:hypothetical protein
MVVMVMLWAMGAGFVWSGVASEGRGCWANATLSGRVTRRYAGWIFMM